jgi:hypothetical protein
MMRLLRSLAYHFASPILDSSWQLGTRDGESSTAFINDLRPRMADCAQRMHAVNLHFIA